MRVSTVESSLLWVSTAMRSHGVGLQGGPPSGLPKHAFSGNCCLFWHSLLGPLESRLHVTQLDSCQWLTSARPPVCWPWQPLEALKRPTCASQVASSEATIPPLASRRPTPPGCVPGVASIIQSRDGSLWGPKPQPFLLIFDYFEFCCAKSHAIYPNVLWFVMIIISCSIFFSSWMITTTSIRSSYTDFFIFIDLGSCFSCEFFFDIPSFSINDSSIFMLSLIQIYLVSPKLFVYLLWSHHQPPGELAVVLLLSELELYNALWQEKWQLTLKNGIIIERIGYATVH